jgi:N-acetylneuraminic acid mutarotase
LGNIPYLFGGYVEDNSQKRYATNDLWKWHNDQWHPVEAEGDVPRARLVATATVWQNEKCYLMGGWDPGTAGTGGAILDTIHCYQDGKWSTLPVTMPDGPTSRHVAIALNDRIVVHTHRCQDYVLLFDPLTLSFRKQDTTGPCPSSRGLHAATRLHENQILFFGGAAQSGIMSEESFLLDTQTWTWTSLQGRGPTARAGACLVRIDHHTALLYGGAEATPSGLRPRGDVWLCHADQDRWELLLDDDNEASSEHPPPRNAATLSLLEDGSERKTFLLTGGWHPFVKTYDDCFLLKLTKS